MFVNSKYDPKYFLCAFSLNNPKLAIVLWIDWRYFVPKWVDIIKITNHFLPILDLTMICITLPDIFFTTVFRFNHRFTSFSSLFCFCHSGVSIKTEPILNKSTTYPWCSTGPSILGPVDWDTIIITWMHAIYQPQTTNQALYPFLRHLTAIALKCPIISFKLSVLPSLLGEREANLE